MIVLRSKICILTYLLTYLLTYFILSPCMFVTFTIYYQLMHN